MLLLLLLLVLAKAFHAGSPAHCHFQGMLFGG
jgi:hypothetical protein